MKTMVDLFCGRGGWTKGFQAHGWHCIGIDLNPQPDYPGEFIQADIAHLYELPAADFYCCSSPCEQFSVFGLRCFHPNPRWPWLGMALFEYARYLLEQTGKPFVMENVRSAQNFIGNSMNHLGPFYLWGSGVPAIWPLEAYAVNKGTKFGLDKDGTRATRKLVDRYYLTGNKSKQRREYAAQVAEIPEILSTHIAQIAGAM